MLCHGTTRPNFFIIICPNTKYFHTKYYNSEATFQISLDLIEYLNHNYKTTLQNLQHTTTEQNKNLTNFHI